MQSTTEISQKGLNDMKELNIMEATVLTSPNPLTLICSKKEDGSTNLAPICFVSYLSFNPPMVGFATGKQSHTGKRVRETGKVIVTVPGESLAGVVMACGASTGAKTDKVAANNIEMMAVEGSDIQIPADTSNHLFIGPSPEPIRIFRHLFSIGNGQIGRLQQIRRSCKPT